MPMLPPKKPKTEIVTLPQNPSKIDQTTTPVPTPSVNLPGMQTGLSEQLKGLSAGYVPPSPPSNPLLEAQRKLVNSDGPPNPTDKQYKMGIGGRIMGTVANFLSGFSGRGPVAYTGQGALNNRYYQDRRNWQTAHNDQKAKINDLKPIYQPGTPQAPRTSQASDAGQTSSYKPGDTVTMGGRNHTVLDVFPDGSMNVEPWSTGEEDENEPMGPFYGPGERPR